MSCAPVPSPSRIIWRTMFSTGCRASFATGYGSGRAASKMSWCSQHRFLASSGTPQSDAMRAATLSASEALARRACRSGRSDSRRVRPRAAMRSPIGRPGGLTRLTSGNLRAAVSVII
jgi:hypothetical protein